MQNLLLYDRSRSNSTDSLSNMDTKSKKNKNYIFNDSNSESSSKLDVSATGNSKSEAIKSIFSGKKWDTSTSSLSKKQSSSIETDSADSPSLINFQNLKVSSKPPLSKRAVKAKPTIQGWLNINKYNINSSNSNLSKINQNSAIKLKHYWCVLVKDYIAFYKNPDDKAPKDYILLKDFNISISNRRKDGFVIFDKVKQVEQEFYADSSEQFKEWYQCLIDIKSRNSNDMTLSQSSNSLTSNFETSLMDSIFYPQCSSKIATSSQTNDFVNSDDLNSINSVQNSPPLNSKTEHSPTLMQSMNMSSRESSPLCSNKASRDSSPGLHYRKFFLLKAKKI